MKLLLDTHTLLWFVEGSTRLSHHARATIEDSTNFLSLSAASLWEIGIKTGVGKLLLDRPLRELIDDLSRMDIRILPIEPRHVLRVAALPNLHGDPFDRMLVAQALEDGFAILSADTTLDAYGPVRTW